MAISNEDNKDIKRSFGKDIAKSVRSVALDSYRTRHNLDKQSDTSSKIANSMADKKTGLVKNMRIPEVHNARSDFAKLRAFNTSPQGKALQNSMKGMDAKERQQLRRSMNK